MFTRLILLLCILLLTACGAPASATVTPQAVIDAFTAAGLEAANTRPMTREDYGMAPMGEEGIRFLIPSLGDDEGGRVMRYATTDDRDQAKAFYDELGKSSALFFSHTYPVADTLLVQITGTLPDEQAQQYGAAVESVAP